MTIQAHNAAITIAPPRPGDTRERNAFGILTGFGKAYAAHYNMEDRRKAATFSGTHGTVRFDCSPARYSKGMVLTLDRDKTDNGDIYKDDAAWLAEALGGRWARGHQPGYRIAVSRALQWRQLFLANWTARISFDRKKAPVFYQYDGPAFALKDALILSPPPKKTNMNPPTPPTAESAVSPSRMSNTGTITAAPSVAVPMDTTNRFA